MDFFFFYLFFSAEYFMQASSPRSYSYLFLRQNIFLSWFSCLSWFKTFSSIFFLIRKIRAIRGLRGLRGLLFFSAECFMQASSLRSQVIYFSSTKYFSFILIRGICVSMHLQLWDRGWPGRIESALEVHKHLYILFHVYC